MKGWEIKKLGEVCEMYQPKTISTKNMVENGAYPVFGANGIIGKYDKYNHEEPQLLITCRGATCGSVNISEPKSWINGNAMVVRTKDRSIDLKYLEYLFRGGIDLSKTITGAAQPQITRQTLSPVEISYPKSLPEQRRIVSILDEAFAAIAKAKANAEKNLKNARELFESFLQGVFDPSIRSGQGKRDVWEEKKVNEIGNAQTGTTPKTAEKENYGNHIPFIKPADVNFSSIGDIRYDNEGLSEIGLKKARKMESGSILMVCIGATIGKVGFAEREVSCNQQINSLTVKKEFEPKFIYYAMTSKAFQEKVLLKGKGAQATLPIINKSKWENLTISFPKAKTEQKNYVEKFDALSIESQKLQAIYLKKISDLEELKKSILQKAFAGKLSELGFDRLKDDRIIEKEGEQIQKS
ncbi:MAG: restriction endonuclease subunit S [Clostridia bacterium]|nr:restriction endonuclease subunit S [Clostridia bacterium]